MNGTGDPLGRPRMSGDAHPYLDSAFEVPNGKANRLDFESSRPEQDSSPYKPIFRLRILIFEFDDQRIRDASGFPSFWC